MNSNLHCAPRFTCRFDNRGFTLVELLFTMAVTSLMLVAVLTTYIFSVRSFGALSNYNELQAEGRKSLDWFARDIRAGLAVSTCLSNQVVVLLPKTVDSSGVVTATNTVTHVVQNRTWYRTDGTGASKRMGDDVAAITFRLYDQAGNQTMQVGQAVSVQVDALLTKNVQSKYQNSNILSARYRMRNTR